MASEQTRPGDRREMFDRWAAGYDRSVDEIAQAEEYPFAGYDRVLEEICRELAPRPGSDVLDLGTGTGNLAARVHEGGARIWGTDLSGAMLVEARAKLPGATLVEADLGAAWPDSIDGPFDGIVSAYVLHEFDLPTKISILHQACARLRPHGRVVVGDIAFSTREDLERAHGRWHDRWDESEHYWTADAAIECARRAGLRARWTEVSACAGVFVFEPESTPVDGDPSVPCGR